MKDKNMLNKFTKNKKENNLESGYILAFALIVVAILLTVSFSVSRIITKEIYFSKLLENSKTAYFAADAGLECAQYLDSVFKDDSIGISLILNSTSTGSAIQDFTDNVTNYIFYAPTSTVFIHNGSSFNSADSVLGNINKISCASDGNYNNIFKTYSITSQEVSDNLNNEISSYNIVGDTEHATTTFGIVVKQNDPNNTSNTLSRCALVEFAKTKSSNPDENTTSYFSISSTGYSSCKSSDPSRVSRTIYRYSNE
jgi:hypothetical protein